jgi:hypothetical protein
MFYIILWILIILIIIISYLTIDNCFYLLLYRILLNNNIFSIKYSENSFFNSISIISLLILKFLYIDFSFLLNFIYLLFTSWKYNSKFSEQYLILISNPYALPFYQFSVLSYLNFLANNKIIFDNEDTHIWTNLFKDTNINYLENYPNIYWNLKIISGYNKKTNEYLISNMYLSNKENNIVYDVDLQNNTLRIIKNKEISNNISKLFSVKLLQMCKDISILLHKEMNNNYLITLIEWNIIITYNNYYFIKGNLQGKCINVDDYYYYEKYKIINKLNCDNIGINI